MRILEGSSARDNTLLSVEEEPDLKGLRVAGFRQTWRFPSRIDYYFFTAMHRHTSR